MSNSVNRIRATEYVRVWNSHFGPGTEVIFDGATRRTDSPAALSASNEAVVWIEGIEFPVPLERLTVPGWDRVYGKRKK